MIPTACASSSLWLMAFGEEISAGQLACLFGHTKEGSRFGGLSEKAVKTLLGNSMHLAEARSFSNLPDDCH